MVQWFQNLKKYLYKSIDKHRCETLVNRQICITEICWVYNQLNDKDRNHDTRSTGVYIYLLCYINIAIIYVETYFIKSTKIDIIMVKEAH